VTCSCSAGLSSARFIKICERSHVWIFRIDPECTRLVDLLDVRDAFKLACLRVAHHQMLDTNRIVDLCGEERSQVLDDGLANEFACGFLLYGPWDRTFPAKR
jgi:hypothetical protein